MQQLIEQGVKVDAVITDVPYGVNFKNDFYNDDEDYVFSHAPKWYKNWWNLLKWDSYLFVFVGVKTIHKWIQYGIDSGFTYKNIIATRSFNNGSPTPKNNFGFQFQPIILFSKGNGKPFNKVDFIPTSAEWFKDKRNKNPKPFTYAYPNWIKSEWCFATAKNSSKNNHPNEKNIDMVKFFIELSTNKGDTIIDPFMGCGTTGIACKRCDRNFIGIELSKEYFDKATERLSQGDTNAQTSASN